MRTLFLAMAGVVVVTGAAAGQTPDPAYYNLPPEVNARLTDVLKDNDIDTSVNPFYQRGDFDGDKKADFAIAMKAKSDGNQHVVVVRGKKGAPVWLDDVEFPALDGWYVHDRKVKVEVGITGDKPPKLKGDALMIFKAESSSALVYWNGKKFTSYWQGD